MYLLFSEDSLSVQSTSAGSTPDHEQVNKGLKCTYYIVKTPYHFNPFLWTVLQTMNR
jgi:hypothetical protein